MYSSSLTWRSSEYQRSQTARKIAQEWRSRIWPKLPEAYGLVLKDEDGNVERGSRRQIKRDLRILPFALPKTAEQYIGHIQDINKLRGARAQNLLATGGKVLTIEPFLGRKFEDQARGPVLCLPTIWCPAYNDEDNQRVGANVWPDNDVCIFEGDKREYPNVGCYSRFLPLVRDLSLWPAGTEYTSEVLEEPVLTPTTLDAVWSRPSMYPKDNQPIAEASLAAELHLLNGELRYELNCLGDQMTLASG